MLQLQPKDNSTIHLKASLRIKALRELEKPVVLETHGGYGKLYLRCYTHVADGVVFEKNESKTSILATQRPGWAVYEADCVSALAEGVGAHLPVNFLDLDPYGSPWEALNAFFAGHQPTVPKLVIVVNDGLSGLLRLQGGWHTGVLREAVDHFGNAWICPHYLEVCKWMMQRKAEAAGYSLTRWAAYRVRDVNSAKKKREGSASPETAGTQGAHAGDLVVHYAAVLELQSSAKNGQLKRAS